MKARRKTFRELLDGELKGWTFTPPAGTTPPWGKITIGCVTAAESRCSRCGREGLLYIPMWRPQGGFRQFLECPRCGHVVELEQGGEEEAA